MSFLLFINCCLTAFGPLYVIFKASNLSENHGALYLCAMAAIGYFFTRLCQSLLLVSLIPEWVATWVFGLDAGFTDFIDIFGIHLFLKLRLVAPFSPETRILGVGLGWAASAALANNFVWFIVEARRGELSWGFIERAFFSNLATVSYIMLTALVYLWNRQSSTTKHSMLLVALINFTVGTPILLRFLASVVTLSSWIVLLLHALCVIINASITYRITQTFSAEFKA